MYLCHNNHKEPAVEPVFLDIPDYWARLLAGRSGVRISVGAKIFLFFTTSLGLCGPSNFPPSGYLCSFWGKAAAA